MHFNVLTSVGLSSRSQKQGFKNAPVSYYADGNDEKQLLLYLFFENTLWNKIIIKFEILVLVYLWDCYFYVTMATQGERQN